MTNQLGLWAIVFLAACEPRVSVGDLGEEASGGSGGSKSSTVVPNAEAGSPAEAPTGEAGAGGAGLAGPDEETGGSSPSTGGSGTSGTGSGGSAGAPNPLEPYAPRSGPFTMVVYSSTKGFRHEGAIQGGRALLQAIAEEQGFELLVTEDNGFLTALASFEAVFFLNTTGDVFTQQEEQVFEAWMLAGGAFIGTHSATDTENGWQFYSEVTGQYYNGHGPAGTPANLQLEPDQLAHPALQGLPNPWQRTDEWPRFDYYLQWSTKPGFRILVRDPDGVQPVSWLREWGGFRSFYTALGHDNQSFTDPLIKKHLTGAIMWAVRRDHLIQ